MANSPDRGSTGTYAKPLASPIHGIFAQDGRDFNPAEAGSFVLSGSNGGPVSVHGKKREENEKNHE
ncbi:MAG: hypothetical protein ACC628_24265 [Pirellulaceae bacterium]